MTIPQRTNQLLKTEISVGCMERGGSVMSQLHNNEWDARNACNTQNHY